MKTDDHRSHGTEVTLFCSVLIFPFLLLTCRVPLHHCSQDPARLPRILLPPARGISASCFRRSDTCGCSWKRASRPTRPCEKNWRSSCSKGPPALKPSTSTTCCPLQVHGDHPAHTHPRNRVSIVWGFIFVLDEGGRSPGREGNDALHHSFHNKCTGGFQGKKNRILIHQLMLLCRGVWFNSLRHHIWICFLSRQEIPWSLGAGWQFTGQQLWGKPIWGPLPSCAGPSDMGQSQRSSYFGSDRGLQRPS